MAIVLKHGITPKERNKILKQLKGIKLKIVSFGNDDQWSGYPELIGQVGKFIPSQDYLGDIFQLSKSLEISVHGSSKETNNFHLTSVTLEIV